LNQFLKEGNVLNRINEILRRISLLALLLMLVAGVLLAVKTTRQEARSQSERVATEQWEYLAVAGPISNLTPADNSRGRKEPNMQFNREAAALEQHLDKLGANGWELVAVAGPPTDPAYYFKRRK
jgi:hypothetical protein